MMSTAVSLMMSWYRLRYCSRYGFRYRLRYRSRYLSRYHTAYVTVSLTASLTASLTEGVPGGGKLGVHVLHVPCPPGNARPRHLRGESNTSQNIPNLNHSYDASQIISNATLRIKQVQHLEGPSAAATIWAHLALRRCCE